MLPDNLYTLRRLKYFIADNNDFTGPIKSTVGTLLDLSILSFRENAMTGTIPKEMSSLTSLGTSNWI